VVNLPIEERLLHYFLAMGAQSAEPIPNSPPGLSLLIGSDKTYVTILSNDAFIQRNKIVGSILDLSALRSSVHQLYLAAPKLLGTAIDADVFRSHGIGLLLFDDRRIEEIVPPQPIQPPQTTQIVQNTDPAFAIELASLKSMYLQMERTISNLREELKSFQQSVPTTPGPPERIAPASMVQTQPRFTGPGAELPSFFTNNPWLEVLSKRGREESGLLAG
jgi:hypothetical protein